jgi:hypothetical protein
MAEVGGDDERGGRVDLDMPLLDLDLPVLVAAQAGRLLSSLPYLVDSEGRMAEMLGEGNASAQWLVAEGAGHVGH